MVYIFMDESGDLGFGNKKYSSKFFVVTFLITENKKPLEKIIKKINFQYKKKIKNKINSLHANKAKDIIRIRLLSKLRSKDLKIMVIILDKKNCDFDLQNQKFNLYNSLISDLLHKFLSKNKNKDIKFIASQRETNKHLNEKFTEYLEQQIFTKHQEEIKIEIKMPHREKGLQIVDFISWAVFEKYERGNTKYYDFFKEKILTEIFFA